MWSRNIKYELLERLGEGGQGCVFKALRRDPSTGMSELVALKVLHSETAHSLWRREFESLRRVRSPYCVQVLSFDRVEGRPSLILEFVDGVSLTQLGRSGILNDEDIEELVTQIELALMDLNRSGIFHGDLSPANVLVDREGRVKLLDFGLANTGGPDARLTPDFASPDRLAGAQPSLASDLYSLGAIERFLRGANSPSNRLERDSKSKMKRRRALAEKVMHLQERNRWTATTTTRTLNTGKAVNKTPTFGRWRSAMVLCAAVLMFASPGAAPQRGRLSHPALLIIRTINWHKFSLNGQPLGYAPVQIPVNFSQQNTLEWSSANGSGRKVLRLRSGQRMVMDDRDFARH